MKTKCAKCDLGLGRRHSTACPWQISKLTAIIVAKTKEA